MRKKYLLFAAVLGVLTSCDPLKDEGDFDITNISSEQLLNGATFEQYSATKNEDGTLSYTADPAGNYIKFNIPAVSSVTIYYVKPDGSETILSKGFAGGMFNYTPKRGSDPVQTLYFRYINQNGEEVVASKEFTLTVATALTPEMRLLASDSYGKKIWKWDTDFREDGAVWGNMGYAPGDGESFVTGGNGIWWGCPPADLTGQLNHSDTGVATGEEDPNAYMEINDEGLIKTYAADGTLIREGAYSVSDYTGERNIPTIDGSQPSWSLGTFTTDAGTILWPFQINAASHDGIITPTNFELMQLDASHLKLVYASPGTGGWGEATWWAFKSVSDPQAALTDFGEKDWTWDTEWREDGAVWGNMGYAPGDGESFVNAQNGIWWGCPPADLTGQLGHSDTGVATGEEDPNAYMTFDFEDGTIETFNAAGEKVRGGTFEIQNWGMGERTQATVDDSQPAWALGTLHTTEGAILWPFQINAASHDGIVTPTDFEIMQVDNDHLKLIYASPGTGGWAEATWWAFKKK